MKMIQKLFLLLSISILFTSVVTAGTVPALKSFTKGTPAVSTDVNGNFNDIKTAVDDNDQRLTTLEKSTPGTGDLSVSLSGFVTVSSGSISVTGNKDTKFLTELSVGDVISIVNEVHVIASIISDTALELKTVHNVGALDEPAFTDGDLLTLTDSAGQNKLRIDKSGAMLFRKQALPITPVKMAFSRVDTSAGSTISFKDANGVEASASIANFNFIGNNLIQFEYVLLSTSDASNIDVVMSTLYFNISSSPSQSCTLLHNGANSFGSYLITTGYTGLSSLTPGWEKTFKVNLKYTLSPAGNSRFGLAFPIPVGKYEIICF